MRGKLLFLSFVGLVILYTKVIPSPLNSAVAFVVGGIIPGTNIMLGIWPMILLGLILSYLLIKFVSHIKLKFLENTAKTITAERLVSEFKDVNSSGIETKNNSVIAARHLKP
jgi:hypothetical protein